MTDQPFPRKKKLGYFSKTLFLVNVLAVIALLLSYSAAYIDPVSFWPLAFFGLGYLPILLINMGFVCYWLFRRKRYMLFGLIFILCGWNFLNSHINFKNKQEKIVAKTDSNIRVMSYNVHLFQMVNNPKDNFREETVELINSLAPDVVCFQEFYSRVRGTQQFSKALKKQAGFEDYYFRPSIANEYEGYGQAIFSKYPIIRSGSITEHGFGINKIIFVDIKRESDTLRVYNVHLRSFALQEEDKAYIQNVATEHMQSENRNKEVGAKLRTAFTNRSEQAKALREHIESSPYPCIVMGDFNDTPMSYSVNTIGKGMHNAFREQGFGWGVTHHAMIPIFQIDYIFCNKQFTVDNYGIIKEKLSDHYPIWADLRI